MSTRKSKSCKTCKWSTYEGSECEKLFDSAMCMNPKKILIDKGDDGTLISPAMEYPISKECSTWEERKNHNNHMCWTCRYSYLWTECGSGVCIRPEKDKETGRCSGVVLHGTLAEDKCEHWKPEISVSENMMIPEIEWFSQEYWDEARRAADVTKNVELALDVMEMNGAAYVKEKSRKRRRTRNDV